MMLISANSCSQHHIPFVTPVLNHKRLCYQEGCGVVCPPARHHRRDSVQESVGRTDKIVHNAGSWGMIEQDHAVSVSACGGCVLSGGTQSRLTRGPKSVE
jgi:hypothetical protein